MKKAGAPNFEQLIDWLEGRLSEEEARLIAAQVAAGDEATQADVAWLRKFYQASRNVVLAEPPTDLTERLKQRFSARAQEYRRPSLLQRLVASLSFDSWAGLTAGVRSVTAPGNQRQFVYATYLAMIVLTLQWHDQDERFDVLGQVLPALEGGTDFIRVLLLKEKDEFDSTMIDDLGEFTLTALPAGVYDLVLSGGLYEISIPSLDLSL